MVTRLLASSRLASSRILSGCRSLSPRQQPWARALGSLGDTGSVTRSPHSKHCRLMIMFWDE